jgi:hypothetical protein
MFRVWIYKEFDIFQTRAFSVLDDMGSLFDVGSNACPLHTLNNRSCDRSHRYTLSSPNLECSDARFKLDIAICDPLRWVREVMEHFGFPCLF